MASFLSDFFWRLEFKDQAGGFVMDEQVEQEFMRLSLKNHYPSIRKLSTSKETDNKLLKKLYKSFIKNIADNPSMIKKVNKMNKSYEIFQNKK
jgi:hypothetical protein